MSKTISKIRSYSIWNNDAELRWLEEMARQGYSLIKIRGIFYKFEQTEPKSVHYCHGFARVKLGDIDNYLQMYADAGWQHVTTCAGWQHYFKSDIENANAMDKETAYRTTARVLRRLTVFFLLGALFLGMVSVRLANNDPPNFLLITIYLLLTGIWVLTFFRVYSGRKQQLMKLEKMQRNDQE